MSYRYKGIQHRAKEWVHACQVLLALCGVLIPTLKAHPRCTHPELSRLHPVCVVTSFRSGETLNPLQLPTLMTTLQMSLRGT